MDDVIVDEGEFCSAEPSYKIGRIPLCPNAAAVIVKYALNPESSVWRPPTPDMSSIEQAVGIKIMWPYDKVIVDEDIVSKKIGMNVSDGSQDTSVDETLKRCKIHDWISDEVIAEGVMLSTDVKEVVHGIPLGLNAASVKINKVIKHDAYLWRPTAEMFEMADALNDTIAWLIPNIQLINAQIQEEPLKISTPSSSINSGTSKGASISGGKSKGAKQKCILLDCGNSGQIVAEGEVFSNDPADLVHSVPLGPNATKVWVIVPKIETAKVWRGNSEIQFISDAVGSMIAWPNKKLKFL